MNLYMISREATRLPNEYKQAVVACETPEEACFMHPDGVSKWDTNSKCWRKPDQTPLINWPKPCGIKVKLIGIALEGTEKGVVK